jgi:hypothetical protein
LPVVLLGLASVSSLGCDESVSLGSWGTSGGATNTAGSASGGTSGAGRGGAGGDGAGAGGTSSMCFRAGEPGPLNLAGGEAGITLTYSDWSWPAPLDSMEWDFQLENDLERDGYFWAHQFQFTASAGGFVGLQYRGGYQAEPPTGRVEIENMAVFWISSAPLRAELGDIVYPDGRTHLSFENGSDWWTINVIYEWQVCRVYRLRVGRQATEPNGQIWYGTWVRDTVTNVETFIGRILVPAAWGQLSTESSMWSNRIGHTPVTSCSVPEPASAVFGTPTGNQGTVTPLLPPENRFALPLRCASSRFTKFPDAVRHELGIAP